MTPRRRRPRATRSSPTSATTGGSGARASSWPCLPAGTRPERAYREWHRNRATNDFGLGAVQLVQVTPYIWVANMVAQHGVQGSSRTPPIRYEAVEMCLGSLATHALELAASVHMPRIGCGLAGGKWDAIEPLILKTLCQNDVAVTVYDF